MSVPGDGPTDVSDIARPPCRRRKAAALVSVAGGVLVMAYLFHAGIVGRGASKREENAAAGEAPAGATGAAPAACDVQAARDTMRTMARYAGWSIVGDHLSVNWHTRTQVLPPRQREQWTRSFAAADACLEGAVRRIQFYADGELVALSAPTSGIWIMK
jgi:hypothetical protein